jgi:hypothetical protein
LGTSISESLASDANLRFPVGTRSFADHVYNFLLGKREDYAKVDGIHYFFIYHPGTDWHARFKAILRERGAISDPRGILDNLDTLCA